MRRAEDEGGRIGAGSRVLAVVGNGPAAQRLCARLAEGGTGRFARIVVFGEESRPAYDRVHLSDVLAKRPAAELELAPHSWYAERGIELLLGDPVVSLELRARRVESRSGRSIAWSGLVLATGSSPVLPPVPGIDHEAVHVYRTVDDVEGVLRAAQEALERGGRVAVLGGGLLGVEAARAIQEIGCRVEVFERAAHLLPRQLDVTAARVLAAQVESLGIGLRLNRSLERVERTPGGARLCFATGAPEDFELVVVAAGVRPRDELARAAGVRCHVRGGIVVDDELRASAPGVYAIGECARHRDVVYGLAAPCLAMAEVAADVLAGRRASFAGVAPATRLKLDAVSVSVVGDTAVQRTGIARVKHAGPDGYRAIVLDRGQAIGAIAVGEWAEWYRVQEAVARRRWVFGWRQARFARRGALWGDGARMPIERWADATPVCTCTGVDCGALRRARADGCATSAALSARTGAGTVCGTCMPLLEALAGERRDALRAPGGWALLAAGVAASLLVAAAALLSPIPLADSVRHEGFGAASLDRLWRDPKLRQVTGFTALAVCVASLSFSLRKRARVFRRIPYLPMRTLHGVLGALAMVAVAVHTGLRTGANLDRALLASFLALAGLGAAAGVATSLEARLAPRSGARLRQLTTVAHLALFWPFPALVFFHVLKVYWY